ncbi:MAG: hypothetical protein HFF18_07985 [Oscillospiraceae bacterium]|nr:hypothetical protein [Oscillospiraceae bacterium]
MKFMNLKRFASTVMAGAMALSLAAPAFAAGSSTNITGTYRAITLAVTVPTTGSAIINPYGLPYELSDSVNISGQQITTGAPLLIQNRSAVPLSVSASAIGTVKGDFLFAATAPADSVTTKSGHVVVQMFAAAGVTEANATDTDILNQKFAALPEESADSSKDIVVGTAAASQDDILTLKAGNANGELVDGGAAFFRLSGSVVKKPTVAWAATDGFTVKVAFTFEPTVMTASAGTVDADNSNVSLDSSVITSESVTLTPALPSGVTVTDWAWSSDNTSAATVEVSSSDSKKATVTYVSSGSATITVTGTGSDGTVYSATIDFTCT